LNVVLGAELEECTGVVELGRRDIVGLAPINEADSKLFDHWLVVQMLSEGEGSREERALDKVAKSIDWQESLFALRFDECVVVVAKLGGHFV